ncbi:MAG: hypothetical protein RL322_2704 [Pseudomonadota bacterium]|jgi:sigma-B regulation protein RsbU (phosphoserine phosphatase)
MSLIRATNVGWTLRTRMLVYFAVFLAGSITATVLAMAWNARDNLIEQVERDVGLLARVLSKTVSVSRTLPDQVEGIANAGMIATATVLAEYVAVAERHGEPTTSIRRRLQRIVDDTALSEIWITDRAGRAYLNAPHDEIFLFSPDKTRQPQASEFWPVLTGEKRSYAQRVIKREIDDKAFKYAGVGGVDQPRIVQVGVEGTTMLDIRQSVGLERLAGLLVGEGALRAMVVVGPDLTTIVSQHTDKGSAGDAVSTRQRDVLASVIRSNELVTQIRSDSIQVYHPIRNESGGSLGGFMVQIPREGIDQLLTDQVRAAIGIGLLVFVIGGVFSFRFAQRLSRPITQVTAVAADLQRGDFESLHRLNEPASRADELGRLASVFRSMATEVRNREQVLDDLVSRRTSELADKNLALQAAQSQINSELDLARRLQLAILPSSFPETPSCSGFARMLPATHMGGDFYDFVALPDGNVAMVVADVSGKGVAAAFFMAVARTRMNSLIRAYPQDPGRCLSMANTELCGQNPLDLFVTVFVAVYDPVTRRLLHANAGHNPPYIRSHSGRVAALASTQNLAIGVIEPVDYVTMSHTLEAGDQLVLFTDGVTEAFDANDNMFGDARLVGLLSSADRRSASELVDLIFEEVVEFASGHPQSDDITVAVLNVASA